MSEYKTQTTSYPAGRKSDAMCSFALAMAYVPWQQWSQTYAPQKAMCAGTIFPELDKPFLGRRGNCK